MNLAVTRLERKSAIESCIRSFIIKSIHAVVQARNGNTYTSNCISAAGPRNNLMINIEEDPEIGATIKHTFYPGFLVHVGDVLSLEILTSWPVNDCMLVEVWQFRLDTAEKLDQLSTGTTSGSSRPDLTANKPTGPDSAHSAEAVGEDSRLFEKLGTLLKTLVVVTRLLPAYQLARKQGSSDYDMCYILRRGVRDLKRLGPDSTNQLVGRLFSGLVINDRPDTDVANVGTTDLKTNVTADSANKVYLNVSVHYRTQVQAYPNTGPPPTEGVPTLVSPLMNEPHRTGNSRGQPAARRLTTFVDVERRSKHSARSLAAFADVNIEHEDETEIDPAGEMLRGRVNLDLGDGAEDEYSDEDDNDDDDDDECDRSLDLSPASDDRCTHDVQVGNDGTALNRSRNRRLKGTNTVVSGEVDLQEPHATILDGIPSQAAFSNFTPSTTNQLGQLFLSLRRQADLDLFRVPPNSSGGTSANIAGGQAQSSVFNADALSDELERHEKTLKEFDDFLVEFCSMDSFAPTEVRQLAAPIQPR